MADPDAHIGDNFDDFLEGEGEGVRKDIEVAVRKRLDRRRPKVGRPLSATDAQILAVIDLPWPAASKSVNLSRSRYMARRKMLLDSRAGAQPNTGGRDR